jgi:hypothetical protein
MKKIALLALLAAAASPALAVAQEPVVLWSDLQQTRSLQQEPPPPPGPRGRGGQVVEEWYTPRLHASFSFYGRVSFPSDTQVTIDDLWYSDFFDPGLGLGAEADLLTYVTPHWGVGGYLSVGWDTFGGQRLHFSNGDEVEPDDMEQTTVILGAKVVQRISPYAIWEGRIGMGMVHYSAVNWSGIDTGVAFSNEQLFASVNRFVFEIGGRVGFGSPHLEGDFGFGVRIMGGAKRGRDVTTFIDPDILTTFMLELGITARF